jgi:hypothetical protein
MGVVFIVGAGHARDFFFAGSTRKRYAVVVRG